MRVKRPRKAAKCHLSVVLPLAIVKLSEGMNAALRNNWKARAHSRRISTNFSTVNLPEKNTTGRNVTFTNTLALLTACILNDQNYSEAAS